MSEIVYLAAPYTHCDAGVRAERLRLVNRVAARMMREGHVVFSPLSHSCTVAAENDMPHEWGFWAVQDLAFLRVARELVVLCIDGWQESVGVQAEMAEAVRLGIPVRKVVP